MTRSVSKLTTAQLERLSAGFDKEGEPRFLTPPPAEKRRHDAILRRIKRRRGRPRVGAGAERVQITLEKNLLGQADRYARANGLTRSQLIARGLLLALSRRAAWMYRDWSSAAKRRQMRSLGRQPQVRIV